MHAASSRKHRPCGPALGPTHLFSRRSGSGIRYPAVHCGTRATGLPPMIIASTSSSVTSEVR